MKKTDWISVEKELPLKGYPYCTAGEYLVTVELKNHDSNDYQEIMLMWFHVGSQQFSQDVGGPPYSEDHYLEVTHWMEKPELPSKKPQGRVLIRCDGVML